jgi:hypothetical protein
MKLFLVIQLLLQATGIICIVIAYRHRNPELPWISFKNPVDPRRLRPWFTSSRGHKLAMTGGILLSAGGLFGLVYWVDILCAG